MSNKTILELKICTTYSSNLTTCDIAGIPNIVPNYTVIEMITDIAEGAKDHLFIIR